MNIDSSWTRPGWRLLGAEKQMNSVVRDCESLTEQDIAFLERLEGHLGILADLSRADFSGTAVRWTLQVFRGSFDST